MPWTTASWPGTGRSPRPDCCGRSARHAVKHHREDAWSELKRVWVAESVRGLGVGRRLIGKLERRASAAGAAVVRVDTHRSLTEAAALYRSAGYREISAYNDNSYAYHWFEKHLG